MPKIVIVINFRDRESMEEFHREVIPSILPSISNFPGIVHSYIEYYWREEGDGGNGAR